MARVKDGEDTRRFPLPFRSIRTETVGYVYDRLLRYSVTPRATPAGLRRTTSFIYTDKPVGGMI